MSDPEILDAETTAIATTPHRELAARRSNPLDMPNAALREVLAHQDENRRTLIEWVRSNLVEGVDYGRFFSKKRQEWSKNFLWKAGAEKICGMLRVTPVFPRLNEYEDRVVKGETIEHLIIRCELIDAAGNMVSEGIGARALKQDYGDLNKAFKMALKSAHIDATLRMGGLSEVFTQDQEDVEKQEERSNGDAPKAPVWVLDLWGRASKAGVTPDAWQAARKDAGIDDWHGAKAGQIASLYGKAKALIKAAEAESGEQLPEDPPKQTRQQKTSAADDPNVVALRQVFADMKEAGSDDDSTLSLWSANGISDPRCGGVTAEDVEKARNVLADYIAEQEAQVPACDHPNAELIPHTNTKKCPDCGATWVDNAAAKRTEASGKQQSLLDQPEAPAPEMASSECLYDLRMYAWIRMAINVDRDLVQTMKPASGNWKLKELEDLTKEQATKCWAWIAKKHPPKDDEQQELLDKWVAAE